MSPSRQTRPGPRPARLRLPRRLPRPLHPRWRRPLAAAALIAVSLVLAPEQIAHGTGHLAAALLMLAAAVMAGRRLLRAPPPTRWIGAAGSSWSPTTSCSPWA